MPTAGEAPATKANNSLSCFPLEKLGAAPSRSQRVAGLAVVLAVAFVSSVLTSVLRLWGVHFDYPDALVGYRYFFTIVHQLTTLALLAYVVSQNRQTLADFGAVFRATDVVYGVLLWIVTDACYRLAFPTILSVCELLGWHKAPPYYPSAQLGLGVITYCFVVINPVFEEMIVRAFLMSETRVLTGSGALAILFSCVLQTSYHLYQGVPYAFALGVVFLIFSAYYARTHRILPVIIAHLMMDLSFVLFSRPA